jgi:hypothetical protein
MINWSYPLNFTWMVENVQYKYVNNPRYSDCIQIPFAIEFFWSSIVDTRLKTTTSLLIRRSCVDRQGNFDGSPMMKDII